MNYTPDQLQTMLNHFVIKRNMGRRHIINFRHDVPGFAGISTNGRTIYIDRHFRPRYPKIIQALKKYIITRKTLRDLYHLSPYDANNLAMSNLLPYTQLFLSRIKLLKSPKMKKLPLDLDLSIYQPINANIIKKKIQRVKNRKEAIDKYAQMSYNKPKNKELIANVDRNIHQARLPGLPKNQTDSKNLRV